MKRFVSLFLLAILSLSLLLSGCAEPEPVPAPDTGHGDAPYMNSFFYDSVEELSGGLTSYFTEDVLRTTRTITVLKEAVFSGASLQTCKTAQSLYMFPCIRERELNTRMRRGFLIYHYIPATCFGGQRYIIRELQAYLSFILITI